MSARKKLQWALSHYIADTLSYINSVRGFCEKSAEWVSMREKERKMMMYIKNKADKVKQPQDQVQAFNQYIRSKETEVDADSRPTDSGKELALVLKDTMRGLEELDRFLDAMEKLAVTSLKVFMENQVIHLTDGIKFEHVQIIITAARMICPLLLNFKRDAQVFFLPKLQNVEVLSTQLDIYINTTQKICQGLAKSFFGNFCLKTTIETQVDLNMNVSENNIKRMLYHINKLSEIRMNQHFRTVFLFRRESCSPFISEFEKRQPRMLEFLKELEECAVQLDRMNLGSKISSVAGSSVGAVGSVLSIVGLALIPFTAGVSLGLTMAGTGIGITSGVNSVVTTVTGLVVNKTQQNKASGVFKDFMEDVQDLQSHLGEVINQAVFKMEESNIQVYQDARRLLFNVGGIGTGIRSLVRDVSDVKLVQNRQVFVGVQRSVEEIPDIGQAAAKGSLALSETARAGLIAVNALFLGMDIYSICKDSVSLAKGSETKLSQFIRARSALWSSEMDSWQKIHDSLCEGLQTSEKNEALLETPFYPKLDVREVREVREVRRKKRCCVIL